MLIWLSSSSEFGTIASTPSKPRTVVARKSTSITVPDMPPIVTTSPTWILRSSRMITPLIRFLMMFWVPKPTPIAKAPPRKANAVRGMRARRSTTRMTASTRIVLSQRLITCANAGDKRRRRASSFTSARETTPAIQ